MGEPPSLGLPEPEHITGLVLAGGAGQRMGGIDKGLQLFLGQPLAQRAATRLAPQVGTLLISANRHLDTYAAWGWPIVSDDPAHQRQGPLAGVLAGLIACRTAWLACVPCDVPQAPLDLVRRLAAAASHAGVPVAYASAPNDRPDGPRRHPTCCLVHASLREPLRAYLEGGGRRINAWLCSHPHAEVCFEDGHAFDNLNTLEALAAAQQRAAPGRP